MDLSTWKPQIESLVNSFYDGTQVAIGVLISGQPFFLGCRKQANGMEWIDNRRTIFEIGSITKIFTAHILCQMISEGTFHLSDPIGPHLQGLNRQTSITFQQLANHTSGLPRLPEDFYNVPHFEEQNPYKAYTASSLSNYLQHVADWSAVSGQQFEYSNLGYGLLGFLLSATGQLPFEQLVQQRIFAPFDMLHSSFQINAHPSLESGGIDEDGHPAPNWEGGILNGCIGIRSSTSDLLKFMNVLLDRDNPDSVLQSQPTWDITENYHIGLGYGIRDQEGGVRLHKHGGGSKGFSGYMLLNIAESRGLILLSNVSAFHKDRLQLEELSKNLMDQLNQGS
ncbi:MAG: serine hydrolase domain-containing protein [Bacteroidota bacterium]